MKFWSFMSNKPAQKEISPHNAEFVITRILESRNSFIKHLLVDEALLSYLRTQFGVATLSHVRREFLKRALKEHLNSPLDLVHYSSLIKELRTSTSNNIEDPISSNLFDMDLLPILKTYISC